MPIYEFYCPDCHRVFQFLSRRVGVTRRPDCPKCGRAEIEKQFSIFSVSRGREQPGEHDDLDIDIDEAQAEKAMELIAREAEGIDEEDPRAAARLMRRFSELTGLELGEGMEEAVRRMEAGEDPDSIEAEMGDALDGEEPIRAKRPGAMSQLRRRFLPPSVDPELYEL
ncbi:MAG: zinc ribbon domain-containing protein [Planctomycetes bacterium]|nr:zinc ribbon domain-containing protein [Planctomycetota bacterium]